jgi:oligosaccharide repeat unit polymerase
MIYILFILLISLFILYFILFKNNILSPTVIASGMFIISTFISLLNVHVWKFTIAPVTVVIILTSIIAFGSGEFIVHLIYISSKNRSMRVVAQEPIRVSLWSILFICTILTMLLLHYYNETLKLARYYGYRDGPLMLWYARQYVSDPNPTVNRDRIASISIILAEAVAYIFSYIFLFNQIFFLKKNLRNILPILIYIPFTILTAGRGGFIYLITVWVIIGGIFFMQKNRWDSRFTFKIILAGVLSLVFFLLLFVVVGSLRRADMFESAFSSISEYVGLSIPTLDYYILRYSGPKAAYFGGQCLRDIYAFLQKIGFDIPYHYTRFVPSEAVWFPGTSGTGNLYTVIKYYLNDFGFLGLYFLLFVWGFLFSFAFQQIKYKYGYLLIIYGVAFHAITMISIAEQFFNNLSTGFIYLSVMIIFLNYLFIDRRHLNKTINYCFGYRNLK